MNVFRRVTRIVRPFTPAPLASALGMRNFSAATADAVAAAPKGKKFVPKNFKEAWCSDIGVYYFIAYNLSLYKLAIVFLHRVYFHFIPVTVRVCCIFSSFYGLKIMSVL